MDFLVTLLKVFLTGGVICSIGQILIDKTNLTTARILVIYVCTGVLLSALGIYQYVVDFGGSGATVPLIGFGHNLAKGVTQAVAQKGFLGVFMGGAEAAAVGIGASVVFGLIAAFVGKSKIKY